LVEKLVGSSADLGCKFNAKVRKEFLEEMLSRTVYSPFKINVWLLLVVLDWRMRFELAASHDKKWYTS